MKTHHRPLTVGHTTLETEWRGETLHSLGAVSVDGVPLRNPRNRFLPWFDAYEGAVFHRFHAASITETEEQTTVALEAESDADYPFRERRDSSGDICLREAVWDAAPERASFRIVLEPAAATLDGLDFRGFRYWFEYESATTPIHRLLDRQTWEVGGNLQDVTLLCRCLFDLPRKHVRPQTAFSTVGLEQSAGALPGNLWARWSLLPPFDMQYGAAGVLVAWFDHLSNIRTVVESRPGEDWIRIVDLHAFGQARSVRTNPKTVLHCPDVLDDTDAINLWTRVFDREREKVWQQFGIQDDGPPQVQVRQVHWAGIDFDHAYEEGIDAAADLGADQFFVAAAVWESSRSFTDTLHRLTTPAQRAGTELDKRSAQSATHPLHVLDFAVAEAYGGEAGLKALVDRARAKGLDVITWAKFCLGVTSALTDRTDDLGHGLGGIYNTKESGRHPDSGYPFHTCSVNLHAPIKDYITERLRGVLERTGMKGFLWDSFSNMGWWQLNYSDGTLRPQCEEMVHLYAAFSNAGFYLEPEGIASFSNHTCVGLHGGDVFAGDLCAFAYNSAIHLVAVETDATGAAHQRNIQSDVLRGREPFSTLFRCYAHKRIPPLHAKVLLEDRESLLPERLAELRKLIRIYRAVRDRMVCRTVLKEERGVLWQNDTAEAILFSFREQDWSGPVHNIATGQPVHDGQLAADRVYRVTAAKEEAACKGIRQA